MNDIKKFELKLNDAKTRLRVSDEDIQTALDRRKRKREGLMASFHRLQRAFYNLNRALGGTDAKF